MDLGIKGRIALVTASSKGLGHAVAHALASEGCHVCVSSRTAEAGNTPSVIGTVTVLPVRSSVMVMVSGTLLPR